MTIYDLPIKCIGLKFSKEANAHLVKEAKKLIKAHKCFVILSDGFYPNVPMDKICGEVLKIYIKDNQLRGEFQFAGNLKVIGQSEINRPNIRLSPVGIGTMPNGNVDEYKLLYFNLKV